MNLVRKKICLLGAFAVGKTSLVRRYVEDRFDDKYLSTIGVKISRKLIDRKDYQLSLILWDLAGGEDFAGQDKNYLRGASGALLVCDLTRSETLDELQNYAELMCKINPKAALVIAANKSDLVAEISIQDAELDRVHREIKCPYIHTSAKTGDNVEQSLLLLAEMIESQSDFLVQ